MIVNRLAHLVSLIVLFAVSGCVDDATNTRPELRVAPEVTLESGYMKPLGQTTHIYVGDEAWGHVWWPAGLVEAGADRYDLSEQQIVAARAASDEEIDGMGLVAYTAITRHRQQSALFSHYNPADALDKTCTWAPDEWSWCKRWATRTVYTGCFGSHQETYCAEWGGDCNIFSGKGCPQRNCDCCNQHDNSYFTGGTCAQKAAADKALGECVTRCLGGRDVIGGAYGWATRKFGGGNYHDPAGNGC